MKRIIEALKAGNTRRAASLYGGIDEDTLTRWVARHTDFADQVIRAEAECEVGMVATIAKAVREGDVNAAFRWLELRRRNEWGRKYEDFDMALLVRQVCREMGLSDTETASAVAEAEREVLDARTRGRRE